MSEPLKLRIGLFDYTVLALPANSGLMGQIDFQDREIRLRTEMCAVSQVQTLIHELIHGAIEMSGQSGRKFAEEEVCMTLDGPLTMILRDNPELFAVLMQGLQRGVKIVEAA